MINIINVSKLFKNGKGISDFNLVISPGDIIGLVGDNGAGKTTLIKSIFNEYKKDSGDVLNGDVSIYTSGYINKISFFPDQSVYPKNITLKDYCLLEAELSNVNRDEATKLFDSLCDSLDLNDYKKKTFKDLSAGMQKKALLMNCLISSPDYIILDEPTANLDVKNRLEFLNIIRALAQSGIGILITSHLIDELEELITRIVIIEDGKTVYSNYFDKNKESLEKIYLQVTKKNQVTGISDIINNSKNDNGGVRSLADIIKGVKNK
ncbi:ATP-binding cassette domain-containing protein [Spiroplasma turonicum]|uniref:ABC transporter ATP-binding protein n=1 Tax=Spiroplasma turonicum TaxID=216946 RepID=A0A0K1P708_9MOLU|nr:ABC transporter ATP-binding protein [Spiroplasma turonicum]AKU80088.1 ABC transporter ATP-binding protein [Spiroplasma turonicum]ALX71089.1 ABC transporter ATP-binding protein [Spiroplasma turonicum]